MESLIEVRRAGFEAHVKAFCQEDYAQDGEKLFDWNGATYSWTWVNWDWMLWNAALDSVAVELPRCRMYPPNEASSDVDYWIDEAKSIAISQCRDAIHAAGVRTK